MQIQTRHSGEIEIDEKGILDFPEGLPGFEDRKKFVLRCAGGYHQDDCEP